VAVLDMKFASCPWPATSRTAPALFASLRELELRKALSSEGELVEVQPTFKESIEAMKELGNRGVGNRLELETPVSPMVVTVTVGPEVVEERGQ
jgi:hypothetical protein